MWKKNIFLFYLFVFFELTTCNELPNVSDLNFQCDTRKQLYNVKNLRVVRYQLTPDFAQHSGLEKTSVDTGVIAQEVQKVLPEAVQPAGDIELPNGQRIENFLVVNKVIFAFYWFFYNLNFHLVCRIHVLKFEP